MNEQDLAERCRLGDNDARRLLYEQHAGRLLALCLRYLPDRERAQDLLHDAFLQIFSAFDRFTWRGEGSLRAWMERVTVNTVLQALRRADALNRAADIAELPEEYEEPDAEAMEEVPTEVLMNFIGRLPDGYRTVFNLYVFEEKSHKEIARLLGINERSSASQLARAKAALAARLRQWRADNE